MSCAGTAGKNQEIENLIANGVEQLIGDDLDSHFPGDKFSVVLSGHGAVDIGPSTYVDDCDGFDFFESFVENNQSRLHTRKDLITRILRLAKRNSDFANGALVFFFEKLKRGKISPVFKF